MVIIRTLDGIYPHIIRIFQIAFDLITFHLYDIKLILKRIDGKHIIVHQLTGMDEPVEGQRSGKRYRST